MNCTPTTDPQAFGIIRDGNAASFALTFADSPNWRFVMALKDGATQQRCAVISIPGGVVGDKGEYLSLITRWRTPGGSENSLATSHLETA